MKTFFIRWETFEKYLKKYYIGIKVTKRGSLKDENNLIGEENGLSNIKDIESLKGEES